MKKESLYERYEPYGTEVKIWSEMKREGLSLDDLDPSKNDPAEDDKEKARKKGEIEFVMRLSGITFEDMKEFASYLNQNPPLVDAGYRSKKMEKDLYERYDPYGPEMDLWSEMRKEGLNLDDLDESKNGPDEKNSSKLHIQRKLRSSGVTFEALKKLASYLNDDDDGDVFPLGVAKQQTDDGVPNKRPHA